jgi:organic radical activating enzyme
MIIERIGNAIGRVSLAFKHRVVGKAISELKAENVVISDVPSGNCDTPHDAETDESVLGRAESIIGRAIVLGKQGRFKVVPEMISVSATENCNLKCVMCPGHAGMTGPKLSVDEAEMLFGSLANEDVSFGQPKLLDMTSGEPTLNPDLGTIYGRFKELFPQSKISMISNGTIPVRGKIKEAFEHADRIGLSMDGATQETYERIRKGSVFKNAIRNVKEVAELKKLGVNCETLQIMMVVMDQNIHELPEMIRLAHSLGIPQVFAQAAEVRTTPFNVEGQNVSLNLPKAKLAPIVLEAKAEAERLGIQLSLTARLEESVLPDTPTQSSHEAVSGESLEVAIKTCNVLWLHAPRISQNVEGIYPTTACCHMPQVYKSGNLQKRTEFRGKSINEIFNSGFYWDMRAGLLDGTLAKDACEGCQYHQMTQWTADQLRELERASKSAEV